MTTPTASHDDDHDLGVLLVHGIGGQTRGETLMNFGEPLQRWYQRWLSGRYISPVDDHATVVDAVLLSEGQTEASIPARAELRFRGATLEEGGAHWLLAESCWANTFLTPKFGDLANWGFKSLPWTLTTHFATGLRRAWKAWQDAGGGHRVAALGRLVLQGVSLFISFLLFPVVVAILLLVLLLGLIPIPSVQSFASRLQRQLSGTIGDSYVLLDNPIQEAAIVGQVARDLSWLIGAGCKQVAVVAHSQGAAVAHQALKRLLADKRERERLGDKKILFATFGSGLNKLSSMRRERGRRDMFAIWSSPLGLFLLGLSLLEVIEPTGGEDNAFAFMGVSFGFFLSMMGIILVWDERPPKLESLHIDGVEPWYDFFASADPVPNGRIFDSAEETAKLMTASHVHNFGSPLTDHTSYWANEEEFVSQVAAVLADHGKLQIDGDRSLGVALRQVASRRRAWRVGWLTAARILITTLTVALGAVHWDSLTRFTRGPLEALGRAPLVGDVFQAIARIDPAPQIVGALTIVFVGWLGFYGVYGTWALWTRGDHERFFAKRPYRKIDSRFVVFVMALGTVSVTFLLAINRVGGIIPGALAAVQVWLSLAVLLTIVGMIVATVGGFFSAAITPFRREEAPAASGSGDGKPLFEWRHPYRVWVPFISLILLSYPYLAFVAGESDAQFFPTGWFWDLGLIKAMEDASRGLPIQNWEWMLGVLAVVVLGTLAARLGGLRGLSARWEHWEESGPTVVAQARHSEWADVERLVRSRVAAMQEKLVRQKAQLENMPPNDLRNKYGAVLQPDVEEALEIAALLPEGDPERLATLRKAAPLSPTAALDLAKISEKGDFDVIVALSTHRRQPGFWTRRRVRQALKTAATPP